jgi:hypothetical protein
MAGMLITEIRCSRHTASQLLTISVKLKSKRAICSKRYRIGCQSSSSRYRETPVMLASMVAHRHASFQHLLECLHTV